MHAIEVAVVGGGPAGSVAALALGLAGVKTALLAKPARPDNRTTALLLSSVTALETLGVWERCRPHAAPLRGIRLIDATSRLLRAPEVAFYASEIGQFAFGYNIENTQLVAAIAARLGEIEDLTLIEDAAAEIHPGSSDIEVLLQGGRSLRASLVVGADGRRSLSRDAARIALERTGYPQTALTFNVAHARPHEDVATEFHTETGPLTFVPLPGLRSSVVWVVDPAEVDRIGLLDPGALAAELEQRMYSILGAIGVEPGCGVFPLVTEQAREFAARRIVLIGEAAHVIPPVGAQGLNLGLRDAATIAELVAAAHKQSADLGSGDILAEYGRRRRADVVTRALAVHLLNRSLISDLLPLHAARGLGLYLVDKIGPLRRALMREGISPVAASPRLMRGEAL
jgi:2-octaprenyl-6-methoxyphenol hydroxylase